jgi:hypothetical protein
MTVHDARRQWRERCSGRKALTNGVLQGAEHGETAAHRGVASQHLETSLSTCGEPSAKMRASRRWLPVACAYVAWSVPAVSFAQPQAQTPSQQPSTLTTDQEEEEEIQELEEEVGDRDPTYLRTRTVVRYDRRRLGPASIDRFRLRGLYGFGPKQRYAVSALEPVVQIETPARTTRGSGDAELQFNANILYGKRFRTGVGLQAAFQTSSDALIGGATTTVRPSIDVTGVVSRHLEVVATLYYKQSVHTARGLPFKQLEPVLTVNTRVLKATWFLEWDSFHDVSPGQFAQTLKPGVSRAFGPNRRWVASAYYGIGLNDYARLTQYRYNAGVDITWYPRKYR